MGDRIDRRTYLNGLLALTATGAGCQELVPDEEQTPTRVRSKTPPAAGSPTPAGTEGPTTPADEIAPFDEVVDVVEAAGCDPSGGEACTDHLRKAIEPGRLLTFPAGEYRFDAPLSIDVDGRVGLFAREDARLVPPQGYSDMLLRVDAPRFLLQGLDVDLTADNTTAGVEVTCENGFVVQDVEYRGRGVHESSNPPFALNLSVRSPGGRGFVRNVRALEGSAIGHYKSAAGRGGIWVGQRHRGTVRIEDCRFEEFGNNGIYASRTRGNVEVVGGVYRNNNAANVRFGGEGSFAEGVTVEMDFSKYTGPTTGLDSQFTTRGIVIEQGPKPDMKPPGAEIRDCEIAMRESPFGGTAISAWSSGRTVTVKRTRIRADIDGFPAVFRAPMDDSGGVTSRPPRFLHLEDVEIFGSADGKAAVQMLDAPGSRILNTSVLQSGPGRDGLSFVRSPGSVVDASSVRVPGYPVVVAYGDAVGETDCFVEFRDDPRFNRRVGDGSVGASGADLSLVDADCLSPDDLADLPAGGRIEVVTTGEDGIYYRVADGE